MKFKLLLGIFALTAVTMHAEEKRPRIGVAAIVQHEGKVLFGERKGSHGASMWAPPGGHLEFGETVEECAKRELLEETGLIATSTRLGPWVENMMDSGKKHYITLLVFVDAFEGTPALLEPDKCAGWEWFTWDALPEPLFDSITTALAEKHLLHTTTAEGF